MPTDGLYVFIIFVMMKNKLCSLSCLFVCFSYMLVVSYMLLFTVPPKNEIHVISNKLL